MPNDVYKWEEGGALVHHCPICKRPLSHDMARTQCVGKHVEWCGRYHTQLFRMGWSSECAGCKHSDEEHDKRHRHIAELLQQLRLARSGKPVYDVVALVKDQMSSPKSSKKDRKAAKKTAKVALLPKVITISDIESVASALHPGTHGDDAEAEERRLLDDPDIKLNLYYHKGTSNSREVRGRHIKNKSRAKMEQPGIDDDVEAALLNLGVITHDATTNSAEQGHIGAIRTAIRDDLANLANEQEEILVRKGGFWRWASRKVYHRLVAHGRLWDELSEEVEITPRQDSAVSGIIDSVVTSTVTASPAATHILPPSTPTKRRQSAITTFENLTVSCWVDNNGNKPPSSEEDDADGWTHVPHKGGSQPVKASGPVKLMANNGLAKLSRR